MDIDTRVDELYSTFDIEIFILWNHYYFNVPNLDIDKMKSYLRKIVENKRDYLLHLDFIRYIIVLSINFGDFSKEILMKNLEHLASNDEAIISSKVLNYYIQRLHLIANHKGTEYFGEDCLALVQEGRAIIKRINGLDGEIVNYFRLIDSSIDNLEGITNNEVTELRKILYLFAGKALLDQNIDYLKNKVEYYLKNYREILDNLTLQGIIFSPDGLYVTSNNYLNMARYLLENNEQKKLVIE